MTPRGKDNHTGKTSFRRMTLSLQSPAARFRGCIVRHRYEYFGNPASRWNRPAPNERGRTASAELLTTYLVSSTSNLAMGTLRAWAMS
jgi:hypothetical protein